MWAVKLTEEYLLESEKYLISLSKLSFYYNVVISDYYPQNLNNSVMVNVKASARV